MTTRLRLDVCYDGSAFSGWAVQPGRRTVAGVLAEALRTVFRAPVPMVVAGRTDAGVHAIGQVAHVDVDGTALAALSPRHLRAGGEPTTEAGLVGLRRKLAGLLPADVRVPAVSLAAIGFDARFSALRRHYRYRLVCSEWGVPPLNHADALARRRPLDAGAMQQAADSLIGLHDFAAFCKPRPGATTIRDLQRLTVTARPVRLGPAPYDQSSSADPAPADGSDHAGSYGTGHAGSYGTEVDIDVSADAFCHSMVRSLVGALIAVGEGRSPVTRPADLLAARTRSAEITVAPARGLTLIGVDYPADADLAARARTTRAVRDCECDRRSS